jgi:hypothetical protein
MSLFSINTWLNMFSFYPIRIFNRFVIFLVPYGYFQLNRFIERSYDDLISNRREFSSFPLKQSSYIEVQIDFYDFLPSRIQNSWKPKSFHDIHLEQMSIRANKY